MDVIAIAFFTTMMVVEFYESELNDWLVELMWNIGAILVCIMLCIALHKIQKFTRVISSKGIYSSHRLIVSHQSFFIAATVSGLTTFLTSVALAHKEKGVRYYRASIVMHVFDFIEYVSWFLVHCMMLKIFSKYGKAIQDDES